MNLVSKFKVISVLIDSCTYNLVYNSVGSTGVREQGGRSVVRSYEVANNYANDEVDNGTIDDNNAGACDNEIVEIEGNHIDSEIEDGKYDCDARDDCARNCEFDGGNAGITNASIVDGDGACDYGGDGGGGGGDDNGGGGGVMVVMMMMLVVVVVMMMVVMIVVVVTMMTMVVGVKVMTVMMW